MAPSETCITRSRKTCRACASCGNDTVSPCCCTVILPLRSSVSSTRKQRSASGSSIRSTLCARAAPAAASARAMLITKRRAVIRTLLEMRSRSRPAGGTCLRSWLVSGRDHLDGRQVRRCIRAVRVEQVARAGLFAQPLEESRDLRRQHPVVDLLRQLHAYVFEPHSLVGRDMLLAPQDKPGLVGRLNQAAGLTGLESESGVFQRLFRAVLEDGRTLAFVGAKLRNELLGGLLPEPRLTGAGLLPDPLVDVLVTVLEHDEAALHLRPIARLEFLFDIERCHLDERLDQRGHRQLRANDVFPKFVQCLVEFLEHMAFKRLQRNAVTD